MSAAVGPTAAGGPAERHFRPSPSRTNVASVPPDRASAPPPQRRLPAHRIPRPLPEPHRSRHVARIARPPFDRVQQLLEDWLAELPLRYTHPGD